MLTITTAMTLAGCSEQSDIDAEVKRAAESKQQMVRLRGLHQLMQQNNGKDIEGGSDFNDQHTPSVDETRDRPDNED